MSFKKFSEIVQNQEEIHEDKILATADNLVIQTRVNKRMLNIDINQNGLKFKLVLSPDSAGQLLDALQKYVDTF